MATVVLRYFRAVGRAQPLRSALADAGVPFDDVRLTSPEWAALRTDPAAGPYRGLPTLTWGDAVVAETLPIAAFIARRLGHYHRLDDVAIARHEALCSSSYLDVMLRLGDVFWADIVYPGADVAAAFRRQVGRMLAKLERIDAVLPATGWYGGEGPVVADYFAAEAYEAARYALGPARDEALRARLPRLSVLAGHLAERPDLAQVREQRPPVFTLRPGEAAVVEVLRAVDLTAHGL